MFACAKANFWVRVTVVVTLVIGSFLAWPLGVRAQSDAAATGNPTEDAARKLARDRFLRGLELAKAERWDEALAEFTASIGVFRTGAALQNRAVSLVHLRRYAEARDTYDELLREFGARLRAEERDGIAAEIRELDAVLGELVVSTEPASTQVVIDGQHVGTTPLERPIRVSAGTHSLRLFRTDYEALERTVTIAGGERKTLRERLVPLRRVGTLVVREAAGGAVDVTIDGAVVGRAPWRGQLSPGLHSAALKGPGDVGSVPSSAHIRADETMTLVLRAVALDAALSVLPSPPDARVFINGVWVGNGVWHGRLPSGPHRVEVAARGHLAEQRELTLARGKSERLELALERDPSHPLWKAGFSPYLYADVMGALAWAPSFRGDSALSCGKSVEDLDGQAQSGCVDESSPLGILAGVHVGYQLTQRLGLEVFLHYLAVSANERRRVRATMDEPGQVYSDDVEDETALRGPALGVAASYRIPSLPLTARVWAGLLRAHIETHHAGTYIGRLENGHEFTRFVRFGEQEQDVWVPFLGPELGARKQFGRRFEISLGVAALLFLPGKTPRTGALGPLTTATGRRRKPFAPQEESISGVDEPVNLGNIELPREKALGTFWTLFPNVRLRVSF